MVIGVGAPGSKTLIIIFGPPAVGKMTVGEAVARRTGLRVFHNHLTIDPVLRVALGTSSPGGPTIFGPTIPSCLPTRWRSGSFSGSACAAL